MATRRSTKQKRELIVVCGPPASGKTTLANLVSTRSGFLHLSSDFVGRSLINQLTVPFSEAPEEVFRAARGAMFAVWQCALPLGIGCIHDATVPNVGAWKSLREIANQAQARLSGIILDAPDCTLIERAISRSQEVQVRPFDANHMRAEAEAARKTYTTEVPLLVDQFLHLDSQASDPNSLCEAVVKFLQVRD